MLCVRCSEELGVSAFFRESGQPAATLSDQLCQPCRLAPPPFERAVAYGGYDGTLRALIHCLKYDGMQPVADRLGVFLAAAIRKLSQTSSDPMSRTVLVAPAPMHSAKLRARGFNHAELLARAAIRTLRSQRFEWELTLASGVLVRRRATESQAGLSPHQRRGNLRGAFFVPAPDEVKNRDILLIDDIYTTGATARACSQVLRRAGAARVWVATLARPQRETVAAPPVDAAAVPMHEDVAFWGPSAKKVPL